jgi:predicted RNA-binding protein associated with RNAse of E/G family
MSSDDDDNGLFWSNQLAHVCHAGSDLWSGLDKNHSSDLTITFQAKILPDDILRANQFHAHPYHHLLTSLDDDNGLFWSYHLAHVHHAGSDLLSGLDENHSCDLTITYQAKILPDDIHRANQFHAHPYYHHLLTCLEDDNGLFLSYHLAHVRHAGSDLWSGLDENHSCDLTTFRPKILPDDIYRVN